jgi:hypothetical protein
VSEAVRGQFIDGHEEVFRARLVEPRLGGTTRDKPAHGGKVVQGEDQSLGLLTWRRQGPGERIGRHLRVAIGRAVVPDPVLGHVGMRLLRTLEDLRGEPLAVVRAQEPPRRGLGEGQVEQPLVALALDQLCGGPLGPDRLADPAYGGALGEVLPHELPPGRDDAGGVAPEPRHLDELERLSLAVQLLLDLLSLVSTDRHEYRFPRRDSVADEGHGAGQELVHAPIEQSLVPEGLD